MNKIIPYQNIRTDIVYVSQFIVSRDGKIRRGQTTGEAASAPRLDLQQFVTTDSLNQMLSLLP